MKILLVSPESPVWNARSHIHNGLGYLAGALIQAGYHAVTLFDGAVESESLPARLERERFDIVGVSSPTPLIRQAWQAALAAQVARSLPALLLQAPAAGAAAAARGYVTQSAAPRGRREAVLCALNMTAVPRYPGQMTDVRAPRL